MKTDDNVSLSNMFSSKIPWGINIGASNNTIGSFRENIVDRYQGQKIPEKNIPEKVAPNHGS